jgi:hypothetical protein
MGTAGAATNDFLRHLLGAAIAGRGEDIILFLVVAPVAIEDEIGGEEDHARPEFVAEVEQVMGAPHVDVVSALPVLLAFGGAGHSRGMEHDIGPQLGKQVAHLDFAVEAHPPAPGLRVADFIAMESEKGFVFRGVLPHERAADEAAAAGHENLFGLRR